MFNSKFQKVYRKLIAQQMEGIPDIRQNIKDEFMATTIMPEYQRYCNQQFITRKNGMDLKTPENFIFDILYWDFEESVFDNLHTLNTMAIYEWLLEFYTMIDKFEKANKLRYCIFGSNGGCYSAFILRKNDRQEILNAIPRGTKDTMTGLIGDIIFPFQNDQGQWEDSSISQFNACPLIGQKNLVALKSPAYKNIFMKLNGKSTNYINKYIHQHFQFIPDEYITVYKK